MLFLSRKEGQSVKLYTKEGVITVMVGRHRNGLIKLGFDAPANIQILREEIDDHMVSGETNKVSLMLRIRHQLGIFAES